MSLKMFVAVGLVLAAAAVVVLNKKADNRAFVAPVVAPILVEQRLLSSGEVTLTRPTQATVKAESEQVLSARSSAQVMQLSVREGDLVRAGDLVALLDDNNSRAEVSVASAELARYQAEQASVRDQVQAAKLDVQAQGDTLMRLKKLASIQAASEDQLQQQSVRLAQAEQRFSAAQSQLKSYDALLSAKRQQAQAAQGGLGYVRLTALTDGVVAERLVQVGDIVNAGSPLLRLIAAGGQRRVLVQLPASENAPAGILHHNQILPLTPWPSANTQGLKTYEAKLVDEQLTPNQQLVLPLVVYKQSGIQLPSQCFIPRQAKQAQVVLNQQGRAVALDIQLEAVGKEGAVTRDARLEGQSVLCATSDVLLRLMAGRAFEVTP
jgi:multidrug efflux pump subunit AcrA (membrane-fusion protein)